VRPLRVSFLDPEDVTALLRDPGDEFPPTTLAPVEHELSQLTHRQPYLLQATSYLLVERLNKEVRKQATSADIAAVVPRLLSEASAYFSDQYRLESGGPLGEALLQALARRGPLAANALRSAIDNDGRFEATMRRMQRREIISQLPNSDTYQITIPLLARYIREQ
jgi:hypothetical protein